jgi:hypothetical protein
MRSPSHHETGRMQADKYMITKCDIRHRQHSISYHGELAETVQYSLQGDNVWVTADCAVLSSISRRL